MRVHAVELLSEARSRRRLSRDDPAGARRSRLRRTTIRSSSRPPLSPHVFIETAKGTIEFELAVLDAPQTARNFMALARKGFFNGLQIHRVVPNFVVQDGDPRGDGEGGPGYTIRDELNERPFLRGTVGMALSWRTRAAASSSSRTHRSRTSTRGTRRSVTSSTAWRSSIGFSRGM